MPISKPKGNMYQGPLVGGCQHQCSYCYAKKNMQKFSMEWDNVPHWAKDD
jgi:DNA repair photolyase